MESGAGIHLPPVHLRRVTSDADHFDIVMSSFQFGYDGCDTDWTDVLYGTGVTQRHTIGAQGGNEKGSYYVAITNLDDNGIVKGSKDTYKRLSAQINADYKIKKWFSVSSNTSIEKWEKKSLREHDEYGGNSFLSATIMDPVTPMYVNDSTMTKQMRSALDNPIVDTLDTYMTVYGDGNGNYYASSIIFDGDAMNPLISRDRANGKSEGINVRGSLSADLKPFKGFVLTSRFGYRFNQQNSSDYQVPYYANEKNVSQSFQLKTDATNGYYYQWENFANYNTSLGANEIGAMVGMSYAEDHSLNVGGQIDGSDILKSYEENFRYLEYRKLDDNTSIKTIIGGTPRESANMSYFGRLSWSYDNKYNLQVNFRADAFDSSKLAKENRWGKFPSVSAGWTISNEEFLKDALASATISYLKLRGSWGRNGNISVLQNYPYATSVTLNSQKYQFDAVNGAITMGSYVQGLPNPDLKWETSEQIDLGLDGRLLDDKLTFAIDYYHKKTKDLLIQIVPVREIGVNSTMANAGEVLNQGLEFELGWKDKVGDFSYSINANAATLKNEVTYLDPSVDRVSGAFFANHTLKTYVEEGHSIWYMRGYEYAGVNENGEALYTTTDADGNKTTTTTPTIEDQKDLGSGIPKFTYGLTINLEYKGFDFTVFGTGVSGNKIYACNYRPEHTLINGMELFYTGRSTVNQDGTVNVGKYPTVANMKESVEFYSSSANVHNGSYFKIKQIQLGYTIPKELTSKLAVSDFRLFVSLDDYFIFTKYEGFDPEVASNGTANSIGFDKGSFPTSKKVTFGLNLTF